MKKAIILRGSACLGDMVMISFVPRLLKEKGYDYIVATAWKKNRAIWENNPYIDGILELDGIQQKDFDTVYDEWEKEHDIFDFRFTVEYKYLAPSCEKDKSTDDLRYIAENKNYYRDALHNYGLSADKGELYLSNEEKRQIENYKKKNVKRIAWQIRGGARNKHLIYGAYYIKKVRERLPDVEHWLIGNIVDNISMLDNKNIFDMRGKLTARESLAIAPIFDLIVGPESFYTNVAGAFDIPVVLFYSHSAPYNLGEFFKYHYPVIPNCDCHPCYQIIKDWRTNYKLNQREKSRKQENRCLLRDPNDVFKTIGFKCCVRIDHEKVINKIVEIME